MRRLLLIGIVVLLVMAATAAILLNERASDSRSRALQFQTSTPGELVVCQNDTGSVSMTSGRSVCLNANKYSIGDEVAITTANWGHGPIRFYLLTEEQGDFGLNELSRADLIELGEIPTTSGGNSFSFVLQSQFETNDGNAVEFSSGDRPLVLARQDFEQGSSGHGTTFTIE